MERIDQNNYKIIHDFFSLISKKNNYYVITFFLKFQFR